MVTVLLIIQVYRDLLNLLIYLTSSIPVANFLFAVTDQSPCQFDAATCEKIEHCSVLCRFPALAFLGIFPSLVATLHLLR